MTKRKKNVPRPVRPLRFEYRDHDHHGEYRVRRSDWPGDTFEVVETDKLYGMIRCAEMFGIPVVDLDDEDVEQAVTRSEGRV